MTDKITLNDIGSFQNDPSAVSAYNANNSVIVSAFDNTLSLDGTSPNQMGSTLDMNSNQIINLPIPATGNSPARLQDISTLTGGGTVTNIPAGGTTGQVLTKSSNSDYQVSWTSAEGSGSVTSVGLSLPSDFTVSGSPVTASGTLSAAYANTPTGSGSFVKSVSPTITTPTLSSPVIGTITNVGTLTLPTSTDTLVARVTTDTLGNKTIDTGNGNNLLVNGNSLNATAGSATVTIQNVTDTLVGLQTTDTLSNKSISGSTNTLTNISPSSLAAQAVNTILMNSTGSSASPSAVDFSTLPSKSSPTASDYVLLSDQAASGALKKVNVSSLATIGSVASFNTRTGSITPQANDYANFPALGIWNVGLTASASAGALTINLTDSTGATPSATSPVCINFRNPTLTAGGASTMLQVTAGTSITVPSTSSLGTGAAQGIRIWVTAWNDNGTFRMGVFNAAGATTTYPLNEAGVGSSTQVVAGGNTAGLHYTSGAAVSSKAFRIIGYLDWTSLGITSPGTWTTTNLNSITLFGPGIKKPGDTVQSVFLQLGSGSTTTSTSLVAITGASISLTPTSAVNTIKVSAQAQCSISAAGSGTNSTYTGSLESNGNGIATHTVGVGTGAGINATSSGAGCWIAMDTPNSNVSVTYTLNHKSSSTAATAQTQNINMIAEEIMR